MDEKSYESKLSAPTWLSSAVVRQQQTSSSSSFVNDVAASAQAQHQETRKWCGCEPGSQCVQCSFLHLPASANAGAAANSGISASAGRPGGAPPPPPPPPAPPSNSSGGGSSNNPWLSTSAMHQAMQAASKLQQSVSAAGGGGGNESMMANHHQQHQSQQQNIEVNHRLQSPANVMQHGRGGHVDLHSDTANSSDLVDGDGGGGGGGGGGTDNHHHHHSQHHPQQNHQSDSQAIWQNARLKADISMHPFYDQLLAAHVGCLRIATPVDQLPRIDAQVNQASQVIAKYSVLGQNHLLVGEEKEELDQFMTHYVLLLCTFKEQLQQHVRVHAMEAVMACWELEQSLLSLTGVSPGEGTGATMSDDEDEPGDSDPGFYDAGFDAHDSGAFGPLIPTETERSLMERVRQELKNELKSGYKERIVDVREEILRKRRAGKLPGDTTSVLKAWWQNHSKWPYPTEDEKARLVQETGLQLKQINNWFINQRKRNWHSNPSSTAALKNKRKRA